MTADKKEPEGVACKCGEFTPFPTYVYAHWYEPLTFTCPKCGAKSTINQGRVTPRKTRAK